MPSAAPQAIDAFQAKKLEHARKGTASHMSYSQCCGWQGLIKDGHRIRVPLLTHSLTQSI